MNYALALSTGDPDSIPGEALRVGCSCPSKVGRFLRELPFPPPTSTAKTPTSASH